MSYPVVLLVGVSELAELCLADVRLADVRLAEVRLAREAGVKDTPDGMHQLHWSQR